MLTQEQLLDRVNSTTTEVEATATDDGTVVVTVTDTTEEAAATEPTEEETTDATAEAPVTEETTAEAVDDGMPAEDGTATTAVVEEGAEAPAEDGTATDADLIATTSVVEDGTVTDGEETMETTAVTEEGEATAEDGTVLEGEETMETTAVTEEGEAIAEDGTLIDGEEMVETTAMTEEEMAIEEAIEEVEESGLFDEAHYLAENPDVLESVMRGETTAIRHFAQFGMKELRSCNAFIDFKGYVENNPDVEEAVEAGQLTPFGHFVRHGKFEKRVAHALFKAEEYEAFNPDVQQAVAEGKITAWGHFLNFGWKENRKFSSFFNSEYYLQQNADVAQAVAAGQITATEHLFKFGLKEKRQIHPLIDLKVVAEANSENVQSFFNVSELSSVSGFQLISYAINVALVQGFQTSTSFSFSSLESIFGSQLSSIFNVSSFSEISKQQLFSFFGSSEGRDLLGSAGGDDLSDGSSSFSGTSDDLDGDDAQDGSGPQIVFDNPTLVSSGNNFNNVPDETTQTPTGQTPQTPTGETPEDPTDETPEDPTDETPEDPTSPAPAPTALFNLRFVVQNNLEALQAQFASFDFNNLTAEQAEEIQQFSAEQGWNPSPFVNFNFFQTAVLSQVTTQLEAQGMTAEEISSLSLEQLLEKSLELGFSPTPLIDLSFFKSSNSVELTKLATKLGVNISSFSNKELFEFIIKEGIEAGLNPSPFFSIGYIKNLYKETIREFYSVESITELETSQVLDHVFSSGRFVLDLNYYRATFTEELDAYAQELLGDDAATGEDLSDAQVKAFAFGQGMEAGLQLSPFDIQGFSVEYEAQLTAFYGVESVERLTQHQIYRFMVTQAIAEGLEVSEFIDVSFYQSTFEAALVSTFELSSITEITAEQVVSFMFGDAKPFVDLDYFKLKYGEETTADGQLVKELSGKELQFFIFSEGWEAGFTSFSAFDLEAITAETTIVEQLVSFYSVSSITEVTSSQIVSFMSEQAWKFGINVSEFVAEADIEIYREKNAELLAEFYGIEVSEVETLNSQLVLDFQFGGLTEVVDFNFIRATWGVEILEALDAEGVTIEDVSQLSKLQIVEFLYAQESLEEVKLSAFDVAGFVEANGEAIADALGINVDKLGELGFRQLQSFMLKEGVALGLSLDGFVETSYIQEVYGLAIAESLEISLEEVATLDGTAVLEWVSTDLSGIDVNFLAYQFEQLSEAEQTDLLTGLEIEVSEGASLSIEQILKISYSEEFKAVLEVEELKLSAINVTGYMVANEDALKAFFGGSTSAIKVKSSSSSFSSSSFSSSMKLKSGSLKLKSGDLGDIGGDFEIDSLSKKQVIQFALTEGVKQGIDFTEFIDVDYLKQEFTVDLARHYGVEVASVTELKAELVLDYLYGGLSSEIDFEFVGTQYASQISSQLGVSVEEISKVHILEFAYSQVASGAEFFFTPVNVEGFVAEYGEQLLEIAGASSSSGVFSKSSVLSFMFNQASEFGIDVTPFVAMDYFTENFSDRILANYSIENVFNLSGSQVYDFMTTEGISEGLNTSAAINLSWYRETYVEELTAEFGSADISNQELFDYVTGAGLENGQNPSELVDFDSFLAEGSASAEALLAWAGSTSIEQVSFSQTLEFMFTAGLEAGFAPTPGLDLDAMKAENAEALTRFYGVSSVTEVTKVQAFNYLYGSGFQQEETTIV